MSEQTSSKVPRIRFKGFEEDWDERTLGDLGSFKNGMNFGKEAMGHGNPFVNLQNVFGQFEVDDKKLELAESSSLQRREYSLLKGDVLFIRSSVKPEGVGETALITETLLDTTYSGFIIRYRPEARMSHDFNRIAYRTTAVRKQILANASRSANTNINQTALKKIALRIPIFEEQTRVGEYFRELERLIGLHQRKHDKLVTLKKAMLQKMFPQPGATTPEIRFKGFEGDWVEVTLGDVLSPHPFKPYIAAAFPSGNFEVIQQGDTPVSGYASGIPFLKFEDVILFGDHTLSLYRPTKPFFVASDGIKILGNRIGLFRDYLYSLLVAYMPTSEGYKRHSNILKTVRLPISLDQTEQQKIGTYFRTLDALISQHATQLQKLQQIKSACLERMFV